MAIKRIEAGTRSEGRRVGIVMSRFNASVCEPLLSGARRALAENGVDESDIVLVTVPGALETPLALQRLAQSGEFDALVALGAVIRGETYHFEIVANESAAGLMNVALDLGIPVGNGILTTSTEAQALERAEAKGRDAALAALELANVQDAIDDLD